MQSMSLHVLCITTRGFKCWCVRKFKSDRASVVGLRKWSKHQSKVPSHTSLLKQASVFCCKPLIECKGKEDKSQHPPSLWSSSTLVRREYGVYDTLSNGSGEHDRNGRPRQPNPLSCPVAEVWSIWVYKPCF